MIGGFLTHLLVYVAVCTFLSALWVLLGDGSVDDLRHFAGTPADALRRDFWPVWVWLSWGVGVFVHFAAIVGRALQPSYWRKRRAEWKAALGPLPPAAAAAAPAPVARRWVTVMFTDIVGSTSLNEMLGDEAWAGVLGQHRDLVRAATAEHHGAEVATQGDGFLVRFDAPADAVRCAVEIQRRLAGRRAAGEAVPEVRVGIHAGEAVDHGGDVLGHVVNLAARVMDAAGPGEILVTEQVADAAGGQHGLDDRGLVALKGLAQARHVLAVRWATDPMPGRAGDEIDLRDA